MDTQTENVILGVTGIIKELLKMIKATNKRVDKIEAKTELMYLKEVNKGD